MSDEVLMEKEATFQRVGGSLMLTIPNGIVELIDSLTGQRVADKGKKFTATIKINKQGDIWVMNIKERRTYVGHEREEGKGR